METFRSTAPDGVDGNYYSPNAEGCKEAYLAILTRLKSLGAVCLDDFSNEKQLHLLGIFGVRNDDPRVDQRAFYHLDNCSIAVRYLFTNKGQWLPGGRTPPEGGIKLSIAGSSKKNLFDGLESLILDREYIKKE